MKRAAYICLTISLVLVCLMGLAQTDSSLLNKTISLNTKGLTLFDALDRITEQTGTMFIFDSHDVNGKQKLKSYNIKNESIIESLRRFLSEDLYTFKEINTHVLIKRIEKKYVEFEADTSKSGSSTVVVSGRILDKKNKEPIPYATVAVTDWGMGITTNTEGYFVIKMDEKWLKSDVYISHLGYIPRSIPSGVLVSSSNDIFLEPHLISIQEVIIRNIDAREMVKQAVRKRGELYPKQECYITSFYREGASHSKKNLYYVESILKLYKSSYLYSSNRDQVMVLKSRLLRNSSDLLSFKLKAGLKGVLDLDLMKNLPDFLDLEHMNYYDYRKNDIVAFDSITAYVIEFEQCKNIKGPLYSGVLYINSDDGALIGAEFGINPKYIEEATPYFVVKSSRNRITPKSITYSVWYKKWNGLYYINHIRGDLNFVARRWLKMFESPYSLFLEYTSIQRDTLGVERFKRKQEMRTSAVFSESKFTYDPDFWGAFNYIKPEETLLDVIGKNPIIVEGVEL